MSFSRSKLLIRLRRFAETLVLAGVGGAVLGLAGLPAGWLSGAILAVSVAALSGRPMLVPDPFARVVFVLLGITLGAAVTPETVATMATWPLSLVALALSMAMVTFAAASYLRIVHGWDSVSAMLAAAPGALSQVILLAADTGSDVRAIAMVQTVRLFVLIIALPAAFVLFGVSGAPPLREMTGSAPRLLVEGVALVAICVGAAMLAHRFRLPGGLIVGSMVASAALHGAGLVHVVLPNPIVIASLVALGALIGTRLGGADIRQLGRLGLAGLGALAAGTLVACLLAVAVAALLALRVSDVVIAYAPGGMEAMTILAFALHLDPAFVGIHQLARFLFVALALPFACRWLRADSKEE